MLYGSETSSSSGLGGLSQLTVTLAPELVTTWQSCICICITLAPDLLITWQIWFLYFSLQSSLAFVLISIPGKRESPGKTSDLFLQGFPSQLLHFASSMDKSLRSLTTVAEMQKASSTASMLVLFFLPNCANFWAVDAQRLCN